MSQEIDMVLLGYLTNRYLEAKNEEADARQTREATEAAVAAIIPGPDDKQVTVPLADGRKVVVKRKLNYKANTTKINYLLVEINKSLNEKLPNPVKSSCTQKLDVKGYEWYRENRPEEFKQIAEFVTVTPAKTAVEIR